MGWSHYNFFSKIWWTLVVESKDKARKWSHDPNLSRYIQLLNSHAALKPTCNTKHIQNFLDLCSLVCTCNQEHPHNFLSISTCPKYITLHHSSHDRILSHKIKITLGLLHYNQIIISWNIHRQQPNTYLFGSPINKPSRGFHTNNHCY